MIAHYLNGALVGGLMAAAGLGAASLISPTQPVLNAEAQGSVSATDTVATTTADVPLQEVIPATPAVTDAAPEVIVQPVPAILLPPATAAETTTAPVATSDEVADLNSDVLAVLAPDAAPQPMVDVPLESAPVVAGTEAPPVPVLTATAVEGETQTLSVAEVAAPRVLNGPLQPAAPAKDAMVVAVDLPVPPPLPAAPDDTLIAAADPGVAQEAGPDILDPAPLLPAPKANELPTPTAEPEAMAPLPMPQPEAADLPSGAESEMPGSKPAPLPGATDAPEAAQPEPEVAGLAEDTPSPTLKPTPGLGEKTEGVIIGRLPKIGDDAEPTAEVAEAEADLSDLPPLQRFSRAFDNPDGKPVFAVVLIDTGEATLDRAALAALPFAVTFAVDPLAPDAAARAAVYRAAGQEVVMLATGIAEGANASDIEVAFQSMEQGLPEAVAVMDLPALGFQDNRPLASLVVPVVAAQGRGLLTWDQGLNAADQVARREDLAAAVAFRNLDSKGEDRAAIRRLLDRAVFKAGQDGRVTVVGQTRDETVAALLEWTVEGRAASVAMGPLSAALTVE